jgi:hypothetical protein
MYTPAKKRTGCNAPIVDDVLDLISIEFLFYRVRIYCGENSSMTRFYNDNLPFKLRYFHIFKFRTQNIY